ncbi:hypothetical protein CYMTET_6195 [Cymbomonas tetramitiformis]|uniref:Uncharacterized protein n=1 Tax=Cymbomonas tetramitiformis TaxID=36881 RepID=A0AAE0GY19_9CHLO|nr:hypothetical protein CYMTET_6195 [Cymbomonas tetramitiformis]
MAASLQRVRMAAMRSALVSLRLHRQHLTPGYVLVVSGGACSPSTNLDSDIFDLIDNKDFDSYDIASPHSPLSPDASLGRRLVVCGGVITTSHSHSDSSILAFAVYNVFVARTHRIFHLRPSRPPYFGSSALVVPRRCGLWPRLGIG